MGVHGLRSRYFFVLVLLGFLVPALSAQSQSARADSSRPGEGRGAAPSGNTAKSKPPAVDPPAPPEIMRGRKKFVLDVVHAAVNLPQGDPQDRLRVLALAASVVNGVEPALAKSLAREGIRIETQLVSNGQTPAVSMMEQGQVDCSLAQEFVEMVPVASVPAAEQSLLGALSSCPRQTLESVKRKLKDALENGVVAPRASLAAMERVGFSNPWSQQEFDLLFSSLPKDAERLAYEAPNFAAMYAQAAPQVPADLASKAGLNLLEWLGRLPPGDERNLAVNVTTDSMKSVLGEDKYREALGSNVMAMQMAQTEGQPANVKHEEEESVSVLRAMDDNGQDQTEQLRELPPSLRAREAAAHGFATGNAGDNTTSARYFDMAFSALNELWEKREEQTTAVEAVEEVSEAAANVDSIDALKRAQALNDSTAQAIGMLAVARVVLSQQADAPPQTAERPGAARPRQ